MKKIILLYIFSAHCNAANTSIEKWKYSLPDQIPATTLLENEKKEYKKSTFDKIENEIETIKKTNSFSYSEHHGDYTTYYIEKFDPVTNETEVINQGIRW